MGSRLQWRRRAVKGAESVGVLKSAATIKWFEVVSRVVVID